MTNQEMAGRLIELFGGKENIKELIHCQTRVRFRAFDESKIDLEAIKALQGVFGVVIKGGQYQVVVGGEAANVYNEIVLLADISDGGLVDDPDAAAQDGNLTEGGSVFSRFIDFISNCFIPMIPALVAAGMLKVVYTIATQLGAPTDAGWMQILSFVADAGFYFIPIFLAGNVAKRLNCNPVVSMVLAGVLLHNGWRQIVAAGEPIDLFGFNVPLLNYNQTVVPIMLTVLFQKYVEKGIDKIIPAVLKSVFVPFLTVLVVAPFELLVFGPLGEYVSTLLSYGVNGLNAIAPWLLPMVAGGLTPILVMTGTHHAMTPVIFSNFALQGYDGSIYPGMYLSNIAQGGATLGVAARTSNPNTRSIAASTGLSCILGITEPALYGTEIRLQRPLYAALIGGAVGGLYAGIMNVKCWVLGNLGIFGIVQYISGDPMNVVHICIATAISFVVSFAVSFVLGSSDKYAD